MQGKISFLIDNDLSPDISSSLRCFGFDVVHFKEIVQFKNRDSVEDQEIIEWCKNNNRVWLTHDFEARRKHAIAMKNAHIHVIWIRGKTEPPEMHLGETATWRFYKTIVRTIDEIQRRIISAHGAIHFKISCKVGSSPEIDWAESLFDKSK